MFGPKRQSVESTQDNKHLSVLHSPCDLFVAVRRALAGRRFQFLPPWARGKLEASPNSNIRFFHSATAWLIPNTTHTIQPSPKLQNNLKIKNDLFIRTGVCGNKAYFLLSQISATTIVPLLKSRGQPIIADPHGYNVTRFIMMHLLL